MNDSELIRKLKAGDKSAADSLIDKYYERVVAVARRRIGDRNFRGDGSEDVAMSVFESLWARANSGYFKSDDLIDAEEFWRLLCVMIRNKTEDHARRQFSKKRGGGEVRGESVFVKAGQDNKFGIGDFSQVELTPEEEAEFRDNFVALLNFLPEPSLHEVVSLRLQGHSILEIAEHFDKSDRWVKRKLALVRQIWSEKIDGSE